MGCGQAKILVENFCLTTPHWPCMLLMFSIEENVNEYKKRRYEERYNYKNNARIAQIILKV